MKCSMGANTLSPKQSGDELDSRVRQSVVASSLVSCGYIVYSDLYGEGARAGLEHRLHPHGGQSDTLPGCYSDSPDKNH